MRLLDTDVCIDLLNAHAPTVAWLDALPLPVAIPGFVAMELYFGAHDKREVAGVAAFLSGFPLVWPSAAACDAALAGFPAAKLSHNLGILDALIGACALELGAIVCTFNLKHFQAIPGLTVEQPYKKL